MAPMTLYVSGVSTPSRAALLTVRSLHLDVKIKPLNLFAGEHRRSEFSRLNPRCCVPTLHEIDGHHGSDFVLWESKAIMIYLAEKCQRNGHSIYPKCSKSRAIIHQRLFHDSSELYVRILDIANVAFSSVNPVITVQIKENLRKALQVLENFLEGQDFFAGSHVTICDFAYLASVCTLVHFGYDISLFVNVNHWYQRMSECEGFGECDKGAEEFGAMVKSKLLNTFSDL